MVDGGWVPCIKSKKRGEIYSDRKYGGTSIEWIMKYGYTNDNNERLADWLTDWLTEEESKCSFPFNTKRSRTSHTLPNHDITTWYLYQTILTRQPNIDAIPIEIHLLIDTLILCFHALSLYLSHTLPHRHLILSAPATCVPDTYTLCCSRFIS